MTSSIMGFPVTGQVGLPWFVRRPCSSYHQIGRATTSSPSRSTSVTPSRKLLMPTHRTASHTTGFLIWVFPSMYIAQRLRLGKYLGCNIVAWGVIMMLHAIPKSFGPFFALRLLLGMWPSRSRVCAKDADAHCWQACSRAASRRSSSSSCPCSTGRTSR